MRGVQRGHCPVGVPIGRNRAQGGIRHRGRGHGCQCPTCTTTSSAKRPRQQHRIFAGELGIRNTSNIQGPSATRTCERVHRRSAATTQHRADRVQPGAFSSRNTISQALARWMASRFTPVGKAVWFKGRRDAAHPGDSAGLVPRGCCLLAIAHRAVDLLASPPAAGERRRLVYCDGTYSVREDPGGA